MHHHTADCRVVGAIVVLGCMAGASALPECLDALALMTNAVNNAVSGDVILVQPGRT